MDCIDVDFTSLLYGRAGCDPSRTGRHSATVRSDLRNASTLWCHDPADDCYDCRQNHLRKSRVQFPTHTDGTLIDQLSLINLCFHMFPEKQAPIRKLFSRSVLILSCYLQYWIPYYSWRPSTLYCIWCRRRRRRGVRAQANASLPASSVQYF